MERDYRVYESKGLELLIDRKSNKPYASISAMTRMCGIKPTSIRQRIGSAYLKSHPPTKTPLSNNKITLLESPQIEMCLRAYNISLYYTFISEFNPSEAKILPFEPKLELLKQESALDLFQLKPEKVTGSWEHELPEGFIYLFKGRDCLKLGYSLKPFERLNVLSRWGGELEVVVIIRGTLGTEKAFHKFLHSSGDSLSDEWYPPSRLMDILTLLSREQVEGCIPA